MALHPPPVIEDHLILVTQRLTHSAMSRSAALTIACFSSAALSAQSIANNFQTRFNADIRPLLDDNVTVQKPFVNVGNGTSTPAQAIASGATAAGTRAGITSVPPNIAALIRKFSAFGGKKNRGRIYIPWCLSTADVAENGTILAGTVTTIQTGVSNFLTHLTTDTIAMVIANKTLATDPVTGKEYVTDITAGPNVTSLLCEQIVATQRRRLQRV